ncbi:MAG: 16S rRNA (adenine(1518)-N(6)/adenine(1519)-N(6))-dimethyltransferase RsmA [Anaerolineae bacterium]|nr:16S rRNA (adenine(1518)-N(6)/adenine(1519)-N(6))-dimethyltransferase RsmA [Anaerolineae bacterium]
MGNEAVRLGEVLRRHDLRLKKGLGQNFLADPVHLDRIVAAAELTSDDVVLEIGPGVGTLTVRLAQRAGRVVAVELDAALLPVLAEMLAGQSNVSVVQGDILQFDPAVLVGEQSYKVVANLPYYITSAAIRHLLTATRPPELVVLTIQREVAQRIVAHSPDMSLLAVSVQYYARPELVARIPAGAFYPPPKVDSAIIRLRRWETPPVEVSSDDQFFAVVKAGFGQRRKQLRNSLGSGLSIGGDAADRLLTAAGVDPTRRAETLTLDEWAAIARARQTTIGS